MKDRSNQSLIGLLLLFLVIIVGLIAYGDYKIKDMNKETAVLLLKVESSEEDELLAQSIRMTQNTASSSLTLLDKYMLEENEIVSLIETIESTGRSLGVSVSIESVNVDKPKANSKLPRTARLSVEAEGSWSGVAGFLEAMESLPYQVGIEDTNLVKGEPLWALKIDLATYTFN